MLKTNFNPICPICKEPMPIIKGQKSGAWNCLKCGSQFWDEVETVLLGKLTETKEKIECLRCNLPMVLFEGVWYCLQCNGQFYPREKAPEVEKIIDQKIECKRNHLISTPVIARAKHKSHSNKAGKNHNKKKPKFERFYYFENK